MRLKRLFENAAEYIAAGEAPERELGQTRDIVCRRSARRNPPDGSKVVHVKDRAAGRCGLDREVQKAGLADRLYG